MSERKPPSRSEDFSEWYNQLSLRAELADSAPMLGCMDVGYLPDFAVNEAAIPVIPGRKSTSERFDGADQAYSTAGTLLSKVQAVIVKGKGSSPSMKNMSQCAASLARRFVVHEHKASRLHYDFRLEMGGVLKSWAIPKGPSMNPADKRLAVMVPDHRINYIDFEGIIPKGSYGAGPVVVWDSGTYEVLESGDAMEQLNTGRVAFALHGKKLQGGFVLTRLARGETGKEWLLIKQKDEYADPTWKLKTELTPTRLKQLGAKIPPCETS